MQFESVYRVLPEGEVAVLLEAGFGDARLFCAALSVYGWLTHA
jgi:hypothetical protein